MKINKILLIEPPFFRFFSERQSSVPLGLAYIAAVLSKEGFEVKIYNADFEHRKPLPEANKAFFSEVSAFDLYKKAVTDAEHPIYQEALSVISEYHPDIIGMTVRTAKFYVSKALIHKIKCLFPHLPIIIGGNHVTANPRQSLSRINADYAISGEGEYIFYKLIKGLQEKESSIFNLAGLSYRKNGEIIQNSPFPLIKNLDQIPFPDRDAVLYRQWLSPDDFGNILYSRGCPFNCSFCDSRTTWSREVRRRSAKNTVDEIIFLKDKYGTSFFSFADDCFVSNTQDTLMLCEELGRRGLADLPKKEFRWWCEIHPSLVREDIVSRMKKSGCVAIAIGAESGSQRVLKNISKKISIETIRKAAKIIRSHEIDLTTFFMIGFPWEREGDIQATLDLMRELNPDSGNLSILTPLPNTEIYRYCEQNNLINYDHDFLEFFHQRDRYFYNRLIPEEKSRAIIKKSFKVINDLVEGNRRHKIERIMENSLIPRIKEKYGVNLRISCAQEYAMSTIYLTLQAANKDIKREVLVKIQNILEAELLNNLPQYSRVRFIYKD